MATTLATVASIACLVMSEVPWTEAGFPAQVPAHAAFAAGTLGTPRTTCTAEIGKPITLTLAPPAEGVPITGYQIITTADPALDGEYVWVTGVDQGVQAAPYGVSTWPADQTKVGWGIRLPWDGTRETLGTTTVRALAGTWESDPIVYDWYITAGWGGPVVGRL